MGPAASHFDIKAVAIAGFVGCRLLSSRAGCGIFIADHGSHVDSRECKVQENGNCGVLVAGGGSLTCNLCEIIEHMHGTGIVVQGRSSHVGVQESTVVGCGAAGLMAFCGGSADCKRVKISFVGEHGVEVRCARCHGHPGPPACLPAKLPVKLSACGTGVPGGVVQNWGLVLGMYCWPCRWCTFSTISCHHVRRDLVSDSDMTELSQARGCDTVMKLEECSIDKCGGCAVLTLDSAAVNLLANCTVTGNVSASRRESNAPDSAPGTLMIHPTVKILGESVKARVT